MIAGSSLLRYAPENILREARNLLRAPGWRGKTPRPEDLDDSTIFPLSQYAVSSDGTDVAYTTRGHQGPWLALVPGFVCSDTYWKYLVPALEADYRLLIYDLRGHGRSGTPRPPGYRARNLTPDDFSIPNHVRDLEAVMNAAGVESATLLGHSMGGQIVLEAYRMIPERVGAIVMMTAPFESPLRTFYGRDISEIFHVLRVASGFLPRPSVLAWRAAMIGNLNVTHALGQILRALGPGARLDDMAPYYRHVAYLDPMVMLMMAEAMRSHSAADVLETVDVPTLIVCGAIDTFTPIALGEIMAESMPKAELVVIPDASHAAIVEKPEEVNEAIRAFLSRI